MTDIILTESQKIGVDKIHKFLKSDNKYFRLIGRAGSGKTTLIKYALADYLERDMKSNDKIPSVIGIALAHKAKNVLSKSIPFTRTFASAYGFKEVIYDDGRREFEPTKFHAEEPVGHLPVEVFVHDEVSQYSEKMKKIIYEKTSLFSKVIFMGDNAQLPPIDPSMNTDADSPIFDIELPDECQHELKERIRQKAGNPILDLSDMIIEEIFGSQNLNKIIAEILKPKLYDGKGYLVLPEYQLYSKYIESKNFIQNKIIAFRKFKVEQMNMGIRNMLFDNTPESLVIGDLVFMSNNYIHKNPGFTLNNSDEYIIRNIGVTMVKAPNADRNIECYIGHIENEKYLESFIVYPTVNGQIDYDYNATKLINEAKQNKFLWKKKYEFTDSFCEYTMGYAINAYRCQGSTYKNVFIDLLDILDTGPLTPKRKLQTIYTALTRATDVVNFIKP